MRHMSLRHAAKLYGLDRVTLKKWLEAAGIVFPRVPLGSKLVVLEADVLKVLARRRDVRNVPSPEGKKRSAA